MNYSTRLGLIRQTLIRGRKKEELDRARHCTFSGEDKRAGREYSETSMASRDQRHKELTHNPKVPMQSEYKAF